MLTGKLFQMLLGTLFLGLGFVASLAAVGTLLWGRRLGEERGERVTKGGYIATFAALGGYTLSVLILLMAFFREDFRFEYVAYNHPTDVSSLAWLYKVSGVWAGREGSLLVLAWLLAVFAAYVAWKRYGRADALSDMGLMVTNVVLVLFGAALLFSRVNDPFKPTPLEMIGPNGELLANVGMNPLLQHWAMIIHPPTLFIGYAGLAIPFAFAMAALIVNDPSKRWVEIVDRITIFAWFFLGAGMGLGGIWAYVVLGWGGYWAWDPVENASLLPWLTAVGLSHSFTIYRRRDGFKRWSIMNAALTFSLVILGTFITRSGIVQSVHAFQPDEVSTYLFGIMMVAPVVFAAIGLLVRGKGFAGRDQFESLTGREAAYYFNNVLMVMAALLVSYMTVSSALPNRMPFGGQSIGITTYEMLARPVGIIYGFILGVCPLLSWRRTDGATFISRIKWPLVTALAIFAALVVEWMLVLKPAYDFMVEKGGADAAEFTAFGPSIIYHGLGILGLLAGALIVSSTAWLFIEGARRRAAARGESFGASLWAIIARARTQSGGYLAHIGIGLIMIGLVGSSMYVRDVKTPLDNKAGESFSAADYTFTFSGIESRQLPNGDIESLATFAVTKNGTPVGNVTPGVTLFAQQGQTRLDAAVLSEPLRDIFMVWEGEQTTEDGKTVLRMNVMINPLIWFAWGGFILLLIGTALASWPKRRTEFDTVTESVSLLPETATL